MAKEKVTLGGVIHEPGNAIKNKRTFMPVVDHKKCIKCGICTQYCPDNTINLKNIKGKKKIVIDYNHCKGCMICAEMCPHGAISKVRNG
jgi:pyruvate ferredoxin oxidoreductase delta subunit